MPRFMLLVIDRYDVLDTKIVHWDTDTISIEQAFEECLQEYWGGFEGEVTFKKLGERVGFDEEEKSYLFFQN